MFEVKPDALHTPGATLLAALKLVPRYCLPKSQASMLENYHSNR